MDPRPTVPIDIEDELRSSYLDYSMSVIIGRALPDVRDGLARQTTKHADVIESDSVEALDTFTGTCDLLYLDSYNITDWNNDWAPAAHHLKERCSQHILYLPLGL